ncbi:uncharacterized protein KY384_000404 [Bacidia gigantensis]|uniref:uncharacterized protein n=1 Tax=Bacidia gigantensis TaxID=2732470 RepID=UPI001D0520C1|nr:uncharacterized protein KY384_000404 [Bacidia gigantensis]KAG8525644.1 hypothetical protein KY384_000404 [Bacidia gigantensis]
MLRLLDLPFDVLQRIIEFLEPIRRRRFPNAFQISPGHKVPAHFWTCRQWYDAAVQIYYAEIEKSQYKSLGLSADDLATIPAPATQAGTALSRNVQRVALRLQGQPSNRITMAPFFEMGANIGNGVGKEDEADDDAEDDEKSVASTSIQPAVFNPPVWQKKMADGLNGFSQLISSFSALREVAFQAFHGFDENPVPQWDYLLYPTMRQFVQHLPINLKYLTLDLAGTGLVAGNGSNSKHLCPDLKPCILRAEHVRLRLRHVCPAVLGVQDIHQLRRQAGLVEDPRNHDKKDSEDLETAGNFNDSVQPVAPLSKASEGQFQPSSITQDSENTRLKSLTIRLSLPWLDRKPNRPLLFDAQQCPEFPPLPNQQLGLHITMALAAHYFQRQHPSVEDMKVSYCTTAAECETIDCIKWASIDRGIDVYKDDGQVWDDWKNDDDHGEDHEAGNFIEPERWLQGAMRPKPALTPRIFKPHWRARSVRREGN